MNEVRSYRDLKVWQLGMDLVESIYNLTSSFPPREIYGLTSQMRRASVSVPSNIAEGHSRFSTKEYIRPVSISLGSLAELETQIEVSKRLGFAEAALVMKTLEDCDHVGRMLHNLARSLEAKIKRDLS
ncbi:MAG: four helix bundle protein [Planctomycetales bacterium]|nr:four helix bundle protein [Planctomycetales bacterium]